jgi:hypothetical protein
MINAVTMQVAVRNGKPVGFQVGYSLNNKNYYNEFNQSHNSSAQQIISYSALSVQI